MAVTMMQWMNATEHEKELHVDTMLPDVGKYSMPEPAEARRLYDLIMGVHGVQAFYTSRYKIRITKGVVFSWKVVMPRVRSAVEAFFEETVTN